MGYSTDFSGSLQLNRQLSITEKNYINTFSGTRRMKRDTNKLMEMFKGEHGLPDPLMVGTPKLPMPEGTITIIDKDAKNLSATNPYGVEGEYFCMDDGIMGQSHDDSILDYNYPSSTQPGLWCQWIINDNNELEWDGNEKFYDYIEWLEYLIKNFFEPWDIKLNGVIKWQGEDYNDRGVIIVKDNKVTTKNSFAIY